MINLELELNWSWTNVSGSSWTWFISAASGTSATASWIAALGEFQLDWAELQREIVCCGMQQEGCLLFFPCKKKPWNIICSMLLMQTSKQITSYGINGNLVKGVCSEWFHVTQGSATKKYLKGYWLKAAVFFVIGEQSIFSSSGELSYPKIFIDILEVNRSQIWREPGDHSLHDSYFSSACALSAGLSSQSTKWMASSSRPRWLCFSHVVFINLPREEGSVHLRI